MFLVINDWEIAPLSEAERRDFWEVCSKPPSGAFRHIDIAAVAFPLARIDRRSNVG